MQTLASFLEEEPHPTEPLTLAPETRAFLSELIVRLGETLTSGVRHTEQTIVSRQYPRPASNQVLVALEDVLQAEPYQVGATVDYDDDEGQRAPRYRSVPVSPGSTRTMANCVGRVEPMRLAGAPQCILDGAPRFCL
jgi:hypothetical protein